MSLVTDNQINGTRDNASEQGIVSTEVLGGRLVPVQATTMNTLVEVNAGGTFAFQSGLAYNTDGSTTALSCTPGSSLGAYVSLWIPFWGRSFGVRVRQNAQPFSVSVDGGPVHRVRDLEQYVVKEGRQVTDSHEVAVVTHTDIAPRKNADGTLPIDSEFHTAKVMFSANAAASLLFGYLLDEKYYRQGPSIHMPSASAAVPTGSLGAIAPTLSGITIPARQISKILYFNTTAGALTLTFMAAGNTVSIPANSMYELNFPTPIASSVLTHQASGVINFVAFGGYY